MAHGGGDIPRISIFWWSEIRTRRSELSLTITVAGHIHIIPFYNTNTVVYNCTCDDLKCPHVQHFAIASFATTKNNSICQNPVTHSPSFDRIIHEL